LIENGPGLQEPDSATAIIASLDECQYVPDVVPPVPEGLEEISSTTTNDAPSLPSLKDSEVGIAGFEISGDCG
jgi:hypothetical protein